MKSIDAPSPSLSINSPLTPRIPQPFTEKTTFWLEFKTMKPPPLTTRGLFLMMNIVCDGEQKILLTIGVRLLEPLPIVPNRARIKEHQSFLYQKGDHI